MPDSPNRPDLREDAPQTGFVRPAVVYLLTSSALLLAQRMDGVVGVCALLFGGAAGCISLVIDCLGDLHVERLDGTAYFNTESALIGGGAALIWIAGLFLFCAAIARKNLSYRIFLSGIWILGAVYHLCWFAIRSV